MVQRGARRDPSKERCWRRLLRQWRRSGLTIREFCAEHALSEASFFAWRRTLVERDQQRAGRDTLQGDHEPRRQSDERPAFVPLRVVATIAAGTAFEVVLRDGRVVRVPVGFEAASLRQLLAILEERPC
jgi:transposase